MNNIKLNHSDYKNQKTLINNLVSYKKSHILVINNKMEVILNYEISELWKNYLFNIKKLLSDIIRKECKEFVLVLNDFEDFDNFSLEQISIKKLYNSLEYLELKMTDFLYFNGEELFDIEY